jgi:hypothetical protein
MLEACKASRCNDVTNHLRSHKVFTGVYGDLALISHMSRGALVLALGLFGVCFTATAQQAKHSRAVQQRVTASSVTPLGRVSTLSLYAPKALTNSDNSILFHAGPVRAWTDGAQLASENALAQVGMAPLGLFPAAYLAPSDVGPVPTRKPGTASNSRTENFGADGKDLPGEMMASPLSNVYYTGEVGFLYGHWSGNGGGDYVGSYVWGQAGNDKFQITAGGSFENWDGHGSKFRSFSR